MYLKPLFVGSLLILVLLLAACGGSDSATEPEEPVPDGE